jgi:methyltransferase (EC 2.1.1.-)
MTRGALLKKIARELIGEDFAKKIWKRVEFVGDIALIRTPLGMNPQDLKPLAEELVKRLPYVKSVWAAIPGVEGEYRLRRYIWLTGEERSTTIYREHGCVFKLDITKAYISPSLNYEHIRIAKLIAPGEVVVNMFAGIGLFSIIIAKHAKPARVYSIDINPYAYQFMVENTKLNKVENIVVPLLGDAKDVVEKYLLNTADRVLMPYPELALDYLVYALKTLKNRRGWVHVYLHVFTSKGEHWREKSMLILGERMKEIGVMDYSVHNVRKIRNVGPRTHQVVLDIFIR